MLASTLISILASHSFTRARTDTRTWYACFWKRGPDINFDHVTRSLPMANRYGHAKVMRLLEKGADAPVGDVLLEAVRRLLMEVARILRGKWCSGLR